MHRAKTTAVAAIAAAAMIQGCSTMDRINAQDWTPYSGTKVASETRNANAAVDTVSSAVADTVLLPLTATSWAFGYRYDPSTHSMRQSANNWGWSSYPPMTAGGGTTGAGTSTSSSSTGATGSTSSGTTTGTTGGTPAMGSTMSSGTSPDTGRAPTTTMGTTGAGTTGAGTTGAGTSGTPSTSGTGKP